MHIRGALSDHIAYVPVSSVSGLVRRVLGCGDHGTTDRTRPNATGRTRDATRLAVEVEVEVPPRTATSRLRSETASRETGDESPRPLETAVSLRMCPCVATLVLTCVTLTPDGLCAVPRLMFALCQSTSLATGLCLPRGCACGAGERTGDARCGLAIAVRARVAVRGRPLRLAGVRVVRRPSSTQEGVRWTEGGTRGILKQRSAKVARPWRRSASRECTQGRSALALGRSAPRGAR